MAFFNGYIERCFDILLIIIVRFVRVLFPELGWKERIVIDLNKKLYKKCSCFTYFAVAGP